MTGHTRQVTASPANLGYSFGNSIFQPSTPSLLVYGLLFTEHGLTTNHISGTQGGTGSQLHFEHPLKLKHDIYRWSLLYQLWSAVCTWSFFLFGQGYFDKPSRFQQLDTTENPLGVGWVGHPFTCQRIIIVCWHLYQFIHDRDVLTLTTCALRRIPQVCGVPLGRQYLGNRWRWSFFVILKISKEA